MIIKITSDGTPYNTKIIDMDTNENITGMFESISWNLKGDKLASISAVLCPNIIMDVVGDYDKKIIKHNCKYERYGDMGTNEKLTIMFQKDADIIVSVRNKEGQESEVEFCAMFAGGGRSSNTLKALRNLALAIEKDNKERPIT